MTASLKEAFNEKWKANISKISNPSKDTQNILSAIKNSVLEFIPALISELEDAKREILGLQEELREIKSNSPGPSTDSESDPKEIFSTRYACNAEVRRVQNTLIVEFREGHVLGKGKNLPGADFIKDINNEMAEIKDKQGKKPQDVKPGDLKWTKLSNPRTGAHAESTHYRLSMTRSYSKKALFAMLKHHGRTKYPTMSVRNETPGFLRSAKHCADGAHTKRTLAKPNPGKTNPGKTNPGKTNPDQNEPWSKQTLSKTDPGQNEPCQKQTLVKTNPSQVNIPWSKQYVHYCQLL